MSPQTAAQAAVRDPRATLELRFVAAEVPCTSEALDRIRRAFDLWSSTSEDRTRETAQIAAGLPDHPDDIHRYLLAERRRAGKWSSVRHPIERALDAVRDHSTLYTRRRCWCLQEAWRTFQQQAADALTRLDAAATYTATDASGAVYGDLCGYNDVLDLTAYLGYDRWRSGVPRHVEVHASDDAQITVAGATGRARRQITFTRLDPLRTAQARRVRWSGDREMRAAGAWVRTWPQPMVEFFDAWPRNNDLRELAQQLLDSDMTHTTPGQIRLSRTLMPHWAGQGLELLETVRSAAVAAWVDSTVVALLEVWATRHPVTVADGQALAEVGAGKLDEVGVEVCARLLAEGWPGSLLELADTAAGVADAPVAPGPETLAS